MSAVVERGGRRLEVVLLSGRALAVPAHGCAGARAPGDRTSDGVVLPVVAERRDPPPEAGLFGGAAGGGGGVEGLNLAGELERFPLVHDEDGLEPLGEAGVTVDRVGVGGPLQQLYLKCKMLC